MRDILFGDSAHKPGVDADAVARKVADAAGARTKELRGGGIKIVCRDEDADAIVAMLQDEGVVAASVQSYESL